MARNRVIQYQVEQGQATTWTRQGKVRQDTTKQEQEQKGKGKGKGKGKRRRGKGQASHEKAR